MISGGRVPGGIWRMAVWETEVTWAVARRISTLGWKKILTMPSPGMDMAFDMLHVIHGGGEEALIGRQHAGADLVGRQAGIVEGDADHRNADIGENVGGGADRRQRPEDQDHQGHAR